ncbi:hypothetical protein FHU38_004432 [Saccharomonospora amisosensis]|uniref:Uncharacterized protein n=1 Tax=Saccharomonospora amisosensis TaxID=1128677 RepID=A0A7X5UTV0_9PSEU|nr:hypothetical protein [Saccharomonospora amisosensis]NIJ14088.1 hypothetical protein [Saccharomonospora amisosensis]
MSTPQSRIPSSAESTQQPTQPTGGNRPRRWLLPTALALGLLVGGGAVGLAWSVTGGSAEGPAADVSAACAALERTPALLPDGDFASLRRWGAAAELAAAAAEVDKSYQPLADAISKPLHIYRSTFKAEGPQFQQAVSAARDACANA